MTMDAGAGQSHRRLAIFDIDGTLCDSQEVEGRCFVEAIKWVIGVELESLDWTSYVEPTSSGIVREVLKGDPECLEKEKEIEREFVELMKRERPVWPGDFTPLPGAVEFIKRLKKDDRWEVGIATGGFALEAEFKLNCCGISINEFPHATSSDTPRRREIIPLCAERAGFGIDACVYFGDAPWDVKVSRQLGVPLIGVGRRIGELGSLGVDLLFRDYSEPEALLDALERIDSRG